MKKVILILLSFFSWCEAGMIVPKLDEHGQELATWSDPPARVWDGREQLPVGTYTLRGVKADRLTLPTSGKIVLRDCVIKNIAHGQSGPGDLELVVVGCTITGEIGVELPQALTAFAVKDTVFRAPDGPRGSYCYVNAKGDVYVQNVKASGGSVTDLLHHSLDLATNEGRLISVKGFEDAGGSGASINIHVKKPRLLLLDVSESTLRGQQGLDVADANNSPVGARTSKVRARAVKFDNQHLSGKLLQGRHAVFNSHCVDEFQMIGCAKSDGVSYYDSHNKPNPVWSWAASPVSPPVGPPATQPGAPEVPPVPPTTGSKRSVTLEGTDPVTKAKIRVVVEVE